MGVDQYVLTALYAHRSLAWSIAFIDVSEFGRPTIVCGLAAALLLWLLLRQRYLLSGGLLATVALSGIGTFILKGLIARPRPPLFYQAYQEVWYSFPSAHAAMSIAFYGFVVYLTWQLTKSKSIRFAAAAFCGLLVLLIGFSRLYLGVHYMSDVVGGYVLGAASLWMSIWTMRRYTKV